MLDRRDLLLSVAATAIAAPTIGLFGASPARASDADEVAKLNALFDTFAAEFMQRTPERATRLGLDKGDLAPLKSKLADRSLAAVEKDRQDTKRRLAQLKTIDRKKLTGIDAANYDTVLFVLEVETEANATFEYGGGGARSPYVLSQLGGVYQSVPDFLDTQHRIDTDADAEAYLARMTDFATVMDQELEQVRHDVAKGVIPPDFILDKALIQMQVFLDTPADQATLVTSLTRRAKEKNLTAPYGDQAASIYTDKIIPALARQAAYLKELRPKAVHDAGVARLPKGSDFYRIGLKQYTTSAMLPAEIHKTGLELVTSLSSEIDALLKSQGISQGTVGKRLAEIAADPKYLYDNTDQAKEVLLADLNAKVAIMQERLPEYFGALPKAKVEIRRVPKAIEAGAPGGYYNSGSLDGTRAGAYYINLRDTAEWPKWGLSTLTYHEAIPGHHLQITLSNEAKGLPLIRKMMGFSGYAEGWALYTEQLAVEMGMYKDDVLGHVGQLHAALFRAVRLVVDTGLHSMGWSREKAVAYYVDKLGDKETAAITEVERYCVWPGQACSYMLGKITWLKARASAKKALGPKFDIHKFHDAGLLSGSLPLTVLERVIGEYVAETKKA